MSKKRVAVYVDGFNLYHALDDLNEPSLKWLDLWALSEKLVRNDEAVSTVKYFTAYATWREQSYRRHQRYVQALETHRVTPIIGHFKRKTVRCAATCRELYETHEEKETDVNIGVHLVADALTDQFDRALIVSADTDLNAAAQLVRTHVPDKQIHIVAPPGRKGRNSSALFEITKGKVRASLLPQQVQLQNGRMVERPAAYDPRR